MFQTCFECGRRGEVLQSHPLPISPLLQTPEFLGDRQIIHLICVRLKHLLYDYFMGCVLGLLPI